MYKASKKSPGETFDQILKREKMLPRFKYDEYMPPH